MYITEWNIKYIYIFWRMLETEQFWFPLAFILFFVHTKEVIGNWNLVTSILQDVIRHDERFSFLGGLCLFLQLRFSSTSDSTSVWFHEDKHAEILYKQNKANREIMHCKSAAQPFTTARALPGDWNVTGKYVNVACNEWDKNEINQTSGKR